MGCGTGLIRVGGDWVLDGPPPLDSGAPPGAAGRGTLTRKGFSRWLGRICPILDDSYIEGIVELAQPESAEHVENWLRERGLECIPMRAGFLVTGSRAVFEAAFGVSLLQPGLPFGLPIPRELRSLVASATIPPPPQMTGQMTPFP
jgi:hypothetical protein